MNKSEYRSKLKDLSRWHHTKTESLFDHWDLIEPANKYIAVSLITLTEVMLEKEFYSLGREKDEYQGFLSRLLAWRDVTNKEIIDYWNCMDPTNRCIVASLNVLTNLLMAKELHQLSQEKEKSGESDDNNQNI